MESTRTQPLSKQDGPFKVSAIPHTEYVFSMDYDFKNARVRRTNNYGFFADYDFGKSVVVEIVIGDSFVEAEQVDFGETFHQIYSESQAIPVFPVALAGSPLSQYEAYLQQACREFKIKRAVFLIVSNDFQSSLFQYRKRAGFFHYHDNGGSVRLEGTPYEVGLLRRMANRSKLIRYLYFHLRLKATVRRLLALSRNLGNSLNGHAKTSDPDTRISRLRSQSSPPRPRE